MAFSDIIWMFLNPFEAFRGVRDFLELGGTVLMVIMVVTGLLWSLIYERYSFLRNGFPVLAEFYREQWRSRKEHKSWMAHQIRRQYISDVRLQANRNLTYIKVLVALAPFLGLLGTVTGMVEVFDVMAITGSGNARAMASGISKATLPTMAGMVVALSGLFFTASLERRAAIAVNHVEDELLLTD
ncbi:MotA/TolQ/ExbB proton channel family protein [Alphaproteobacteria bacterium]|jgi:biopolymer transport protein ExbB|nr:MotA/TolQ/ExbB proton channel family protein [Alphaproteobacteria bacterium]